MNASIRSRQAAIAHANGGRTEHRRPYRVVVFTAKYAYELWTPEQHYQEARLPSAGSFLFPGIHRVREAAILALALQDTRQAQIRTNQDRKVWLFNKHPDGRITGYKPD